MLSTTRSGLDDPDAQLLTRSGQKLGSAHESMAAPPCQRSCVPRGGICERNWSNPGGPPKYHCAVCEKPMTSMHAPAAPGVAVGVGSGVAVGGGDAVGGGVPAVEAAVGAGVAP